jgi:hypothetical protein
MVSYKFLGDQVFCEDRTLAEFQKCITFSKDERKVKMKQAELYNSRFYNDVNKTAFDSASVVIPIVLEVLPKVDSAIDFGCGEGMWLSILKRNGVSEIKGLDGEWVNKKHLKILEAEFILADLKSIEYDGKRYDLAISLEVAEHLPQSSAATFVKSLTRASDFVLFSSAIPFQGGTDHVNEQWPSYWANLFGTNGFLCVDFLRDKIWDIDTIAPYYRQNILLFVNQKRMGDLRSLVMSSSPSPRIHPKLRFQRFVTRICGPTLVNYIIKVKNTFR